MGDCTGGKKDAKDSRDDSLREYFEKDRKRVGERKGNRVYLGGGSYEFDIRPCGGHSLGGLLKRIK